MALKGFEPLFAREFTKLRMIDERISERLTSVNLSAESPLVVVLCSVDASRFKLESSRFDRKNYGIYLLHHGTETSVRCLLASEREYEPALKGVVLTSKLLLNREVIPYIQFEFIA